MFPFLLPRKGWTKWCRKGPAQIRAVYQMAVFWLSDPTSAGRLTVLESTAWALTPLMPKEDVPAT